jgi:glycosyltransferase involved in cell wall biosynthesis
MYRRLSAPGTLVVDGVDEWAGALQKLASDPGLRAELGRAGRQWAERHHDTRLARRRLTALLGYPEPEDGSVRPVR